MIDTGEKNYKLGILGWPLAHRRGSWDYAKLYDRNIRSELFYKDQRQLHFL